MKAALLSHYGTATTPVRRTPHRGRQQQRHVAIDVTFRVPAARISTAVRLAQPVAFAVTGDFTADAEMAVDTGWTAAALPGLDVATGVTVGFAGTATPHARTQMTADVSSILEDEDDLLTAF